MPLSVCERIEPSSPRPCEGLRCCCRFFEVLRSRHPPTQSPANNGAGQRRHVPGATPELGPGVRRASWALAASERGQTPLRSARNSDAAANAGAHTAGAGIPQGLNCLQASRGPAVQTAQHASHRRSFLAHAAIVNRATIVQTIDSGYGWNCAVAGRSAKRATKRAITKI